MGHLRLVDDLQAEGRHLTDPQRDDIVASLDGGIKGPVSLTASASDPEAVRYESEIACVIEDVGCAVEIANARANSSTEEIPAGVEFSIKETTVRPHHAGPIVAAFRRAGVAIATKINARRRKNDTLYITVGPDDHS
jgi:hypothetical protein